MLYQRCVPSMCDFEGCGILVASEYLSFSLFLSLPSVPNYVFFPLDWGRGGRGGGGGGSRVVRWCSVSFQCRGVLHIWRRVGQGPTVLAVSAGGGCLDIFSLLCHFSFLSPSLWETARYRLKYCLKGSLNPKQPTSQPTS